MTTASHPDDRGIVLRVSWLDASSALGKVTRISSARVATRKEAKSYAEEIQRGKAR